MDVDGNIQYAKKDYEVAISEDAYAENISIVLDEAIIVRDIQICEFGVEVGTTQWNSIGIVEFEAYSNEITDESIIQQV